MADITTPSLAELVRDIQADLISRRGADALLRRSDDAVYARVIAGVSAALYAMIKRVAREVNTVTAELTLDDKANFYLQGDPRRPATYAGGQVTVTGTVGDVIAAGTEFVGVTSGLAYAVVDDVVFTATSMTVDVEAVEAGTGSNLAEGEQLMIGTPTGSVQTIAISRGITGGADEEDDESLRARILEIRRNPPGGGNKTDLIRWAKQVSGVTRAWVSTGENGAGTATIRFVCDGADDPIPTSADEQKVYDHLHDLVPVTLVENYSVVAPVRNAVDLTIELVADSTAIRSAITAAVDDFFRRESEPGGTVYISRLIEAISAASGEYAHRLVSPTVDIVAGTNQVSLLGDITWQ